MKVKMDIDEIYYKGHCHKRVDTPNPIDRLYGEVKETNDLASEIMMQLLCGNLRMTVDTKCILKKCLEISKQNHNIIKNVLRGIRR